MGNGKKGTTKSFRQSKELQTIGREGGHVCMCSQKQPVPGQTGQFVYTLHRTISIHIHRYGVCTSINQSINGQYLLNTKLSQNNSVTVSNKAVILVSV